MNQIPSSFPPLEGVESVSEGFVVHVLPRASSAKEKRARTPLKDGHCMRASPALSLTHLSLDFHRRPPAGPGGRILEFLS